MRQDQLETEPGATDTGRESVNVLLAGFLLLALALWLIALTTGKLAAIRQLVHPYLPTWFSVANALLVPVTGALVALRSIPFRVSFFFGLAFLAQVSLLGVTAQDYPVVKAMVTVFLYYEAFVLIPNWNRRILERTRGGSVLGLERPSIPAINSRGDRKI